MFLATHPRLTCLLLDSSIDSPADILSLSREKIEESKIEDIELIVLSNHCLSLRLKINDTNICVQVASRLLELSKLEKNRRSRIIVD